MCGAMVAPFHALTSVPTAQQHLALMQVMLLSCADVNTSTSVENCLSCHLVFIQDSVCSRVCPFTVLELSDSCQMSWPVATE